MSASLSSKENTGPAISSQGFEQDSERPRCQDGSVPKSRPHAKSWMDSVQCMGYHVAEHGVQFQIIIGVDFGNRKA